MERPICVIGAGLAGCEAALQLARRGLSVRLYEMKPARKTPAHVADSFAELVCSNSLRSSSLDSAVGVLKEEMRRAGGALITFADETQVPAGAALAVDREQFSRAVTEAIAQAERIEVVREEVIELPEEETIVASGPLTSEPLATAIQDRTHGLADLHFYDAIAPIVAADSIDRETVFLASRYGKGGGADYLNCPMNEEQYRIFVEAVSAAEKVAPRPFEEERFFESCLPIETIVERGFDTLRFGCMKPVGLEDPRTNQMPYAVVQLRSENRDLTAYNIVGFQTRMKHGAQDRVLRLIPGLEQAEFLRMGSVHRNTYLDAPKLLDEQLRLKGHEQIQFAGQITGVEGYVESIACGLLVGRFVADRVLERPFRPPPATTALGGLYHHVQASHQPPGKRGFVPSNSHWGLSPALGRKARKKDRKRLYGERALADLMTWLKNE